MRCLGLLVLLLGLVQTRAEAAAPPVASQDLRCFVLYTIAVGNEKDEKKLTGEIAGTWYFFGRLDAVAPGFNVKQALEAGLADLQGNPKAEEIGKACDDQFAKRGGDMSNAGDAMEKEGK